MRAGLRPLVEQLLDDVPIKGVALFHAHVQQLKGILEARQAACPLFLGGAARPFVGRRERTRQRIDRRAGSLKAQLDLLELGADDGICPSSDSIRASAATPRFSDSLADPIASRSAPIRPIVSAPCLNDTSAWGKRSISRANCPIGTRRLSPSRSVCSCNDRTAGSITSARRFPISVSCGPMASIKRSASGLSVPTRGST